MTRDELEKLAVRVENDLGCDNALDVLVEVALYAPADGYVSARPNAAGTKVIYTSADGLQSTHWAPEWTGDRTMTTAKLRARARAGARS